MKVRLLAAVTAASVAGGALAQEFYMGQIIALGSNYCPTGSIPASGQLLDIAQNSTLFSLFGTTYGGDGRSNFGVPDLRAKNADGQPIEVGQPGAALLQCIVGQGVYPPRN